MAVNITQDEMDLFNKNGISENDIMQTVNNYRADGLSDADIRAKFEAKMNTFNAPVEDNTPIRYEEGKPFEVQASKYNPMYEDIMTNDSLTREQKVQAIKERGEAERKQYDKELRNYLTKQYAGAALEIGSAAIPVGGSAKLASGVIKLAKPYLGKKIAQEVGTGLVSGALSGGVFGAGRGLMEDKNLIATGLQDATIGGLSGGAIGGVVGKVGKNIAGKNLKKIDNLQELRKAETKFYKNYLQETKVNRNDLGDINFTQAGLETVSKQPQAGRNFATIKNDIKTAKYLRPEKPNHDRIDNIVKFHRLEKDGQQFLIGETKDGNKYYMSKMIDGSEARPIRVGTEPSDNIINDVSKNFNPSEKITRRSLENEAKDIRNSINDLKLDLTPKTNIKMARSGNFWSKNIDDPLTKGIREAEEELNSIIKEIEKNPEIINTAEGLEGFETRLANKINFPDDELNTDFYNRYWQAIVKAENYLNTLKQAGEMKGRGLSRSVLAAKGTPKEVKTIIKNDLPEYAVMHNNELTAQAVNDVESNFANEYSRLATSKEFDALDYEKSRQIAKRLFDAGRHEEAINLIDNVSENATKKGQAIQALSLWSNMTPEGAVFKAEKLIREYNGKVPARKHIKLTKENIDAIRDLQNKALEATDDLEKAQALARTAKYVSELVPKNLGQKLKAYRNIALLLNPKTLGRNVIGNALFNTVDTVSKGLAVPFDRAIGLVTGQKTRTLPQLNELVQGGIKGAKTGFKEALEGIDTRGLGQRFDLQSGRVFKNPFMQKLETALDVGLRTPDRMQYEATFAESVANMMKAQGLKQPTQEILEQAEKEALESVFQNDSVISNMTLGLRNKVLNNIGTKDLGLGDLLIPYAQTPANLVQQAINYSPAGIVKGVMNLAQGNQRQASLDLARALVGSGLIGTGYGLSKAGIMTPSQFDDSYNKNKLIKNNLQTIGIRPEQIGGLWYAPFQPVSTSFAIGNAMANGENPMQAGLNTMLDLPFLQNVSRGLSDVKDKGIAEAGINFASSVPAQFVPTALGQASQLLDNTQRETYNQNKLMQGINQAIAKTPLSVTLPEKIDVTGQPIQRYDSEGVQRVFDTFLNPTYINDRKEDVVIDELKSLYDKTGETKQFLPVVNKKINVRINNEMQQKDLTGEEQSEYQMNVGKINKLLYEDAINSPQYQQMDDTERIKFLNDIRQSVDEAAKIYLFDHEPIQNKSGSYKLHKYTKQILDNYEDYLN